MENVRRSHISCRTVCALQASRGHTAGPSSARPQLFWASSGLSSYSVWCKQLSSPDPGSFLYQSSRGGGGCHPCPLPDLASWLSAPPALTNQTPLPHPRYSAWGSCDLQLGCVHGGKQIAQYEQEDKWGNSELVQGGLLAQMLGFCLSSGRGHWVWSGSAGGLGAQTPGFSPISEREVWGMMS